MKKKLEPFGNDPIDELEDPSLTAPKAGSLATANAKELLSGGVKDTALQLMGSEKQKNKEEKDEV